MTDFGHAACMYTFMCMTHYFACIIDLWYVTALYNLQTLQHLCSESFKLRLDYSWCGPVCYVNSKLIGAQLLTYIKHIHTFTRHSQKACIHKMNVTNNDFVQPYQSVHVLLPNRSSHVHFITLRAAQHFFFGYDYVLLITCRPPVCLRPESRAMGRGKGL